MEVSKNGMLLVGDWLGEQDGNKFWTNEQLAVWHEHHKKRVDRASRFSSPAEDLKTVEAFEKEINRREGRRYIGVKGGKL